eukprot:1737470-Rhodomonas_salina.1
MDQTQAFGPGARRSSAGRKAGTRSPLPRHPAASSTGESSVRASAAKSKDTDKDPSRANCVMQTKTDFRKTGGHLAVT